MPKTNIYGRAAAGQDRSDTRIELGWIPGAGADMAITRLREGADPDTEYTPATVSIQTENSTMSITDPNQSVRTWDGLWIDLDRDTINRLIRELRTVRDKAYGRDE